MTGRQEDVTKVAAHCENVPDGVDVHLEVMMEHLVEKRKENQRLAFCERIGGLFAAFGCSC